MMSVCAMTRNVLNHVFHNVQMSIHLIVCLLRLFMGLTDRLEID
jgi:hypothetical protein